MPDAPPELAAVLWDMDGTLVDTEPYWIAAEYALVESFGGTWSDEHAHSLVGSDLLVAAAYIREHGGVDLEPAEIVERMLAQVIASVKGHIPWMPNARELLRQLGEAGIPCGLVTMSWTSLAMAVVEQLPVGTFSVVVTGDSVTQGKPHPEPYLRGAELLGVRPQDCVAFEDSPTGVASAQAAGCVTVAIPHVAEVAEDPGRTIIDSLGGVTVDGLRDLVRGRGALVDA
ncbi:MAG: HAD family phosphatase [Solirubrobacteraceae bacterium]|nr:HAD family phosphatase [Solirubrobacteraceae bacterium]